MLFTFLLVIFIVDIIILIPIILLQSGSGAQSGMFGNDLTFGAFGAKTSEVLITMTKWLVGIFVVVALILGWIKIQESKSLVQRSNQVVEAPVTETAPNQQSGATNSGFQIPGMNQTNFK